MAGLLTTPVTDQDREANDGHRPWVVAAVLAVLAVYLYLFTHIADTLHLPAPQDLAERLAVQVRYIFDSDRNVDSKVRIIFTQRFESNDDERLVFYLAVIGAFLSAYYLPVRRKQPALVFWTVAAIVFLYGVPAAAVLVCAHVVIYLTLHPKRETGLLWGALPGFLLAAAYAGSRGEPPTFSVLLPLVSALIYRYALLPLLALPRIAPILRTAVIQSALITVIIGALMEGISGEEWKLPLGILFFFWQWERLMMYHIDFKDGLVPEDISLWRYLAVFLSPGAVPNFHMRVAIGQGYAYVNNIFLCEDKNKIVLGGVKILLVALAYLVFGDWIRYSLVDFFDARDIPVYNARIKHMIQHFMRGEEISTPSVLLTSMLDLGRWILLYASVAHLRVGLWRICGYRMDPSFNKPWLATNLVTFWSRFTFHYREFLVRAFYYPVFFRFFKKHPMTRVVMATLAAITVGNLIWGHLAADMYFQGVEFRRFSVTFGTWPYFVFLGLGIAFTELYLLRRKRTRRPWTMDGRIVMDVIAVYCTMQFYALIHIFVAPRAGATVWDMFRLFLIGFGVRL